MEANYGQLLRPIFDAASDITDPVDRLRAIDQVRGAMREVLTRLYEQAAWEARALNVADAAVQASSLTHTSLVAYSVSRNRALGAQARSRWADPMGGHQVADLTEVAQFQTPQQVRPRRRKRRPNRGQQRQRNQVKLPPVVEDHPADGSGDRWVTRRPPVAAPAQVDQVLRHVQPRRAAHGQRPPVVDFPADPGAPFAPPAGAGFDQGANPGGDHEANV